MLTVPTRVNGAYGSTVVSWSSRQPVHPLQKPKSSMVNPFSPIAHDQVLFGSGNNSGWGRRALLIGGAALAFLYASVACGGQQDATVAPPNVIVAPGETLPDVNGIVYLTPTELLQKVEADQVGEIQIVPGPGNSSLLWKVTLTSGVVQFYQPDPQQKGHDKLVEKLREKGIHPYVAEEDAPNVFLIMLMQFAPFILIAGLAIFLMRKMMRGAGGGIGGMTPANEQKLGNIDEIPKTRLEDVAGIPEVIEEIRADIIDLFRNPESKVGEKLPRGILLEGPPGTGKTLLAEAIAGELRRPFYSVSGSEFVEMFVGVGAKRVRDLFSKANVNAPSVIFIDEIDAVGQKRGRGINSNDEREQTLNQILKEMNGFASKNNVLVIAATNRADMLDPALLRPGRFDKKYTITPPMTPAGRRDILNVHLKGKKVAADVDPLFIAQRMWPGTSGAEIAEIVNSAALLARRRKHEAITKEDFLDAIERKRLGLPKKDAAFTPEVKRRVAGHEALGHAATWYAMGHKPQFITIIPRNMEGGGTALGLMGIDPESIPPYLQTREFIEDMACMILGGRAAEEAMYGTHNVSTGASNDWEKVNQMMKNAIEASALYPEKFGQLVIPQDEGMFAPGGGVSQELRAKGEHVRNDLIQNLYEATLAFVSAIPEASRTKILEQVETAETINDPTAIEAMFQSAGVDLQKLWKQTASPIRARTQAT